MDILVSVITPVYNCEKFIEESLDSILPQIKENYELIIWDDGSTDNTFDIVARMCGDNNNVSIISLNKNHGCAYCSDHIIKLFAVGKYIAIHDADDISLPHRLERQVDFLEQNNLFCLGGWAEKIDTEGNSLGTMHYPPKTDYDIKMQLANNTCCPMINPSAIFRRDVFLKLGGYKYKDELIKYVQDFELWFNAASNRYTFDNLREELIKYRINPNGVTARLKDVMIKAHCKVLINYRNYVKVLRKGEII